MKKTNRADMCVNMWYPASTIKNEETTSCEGGNGRERERERERERKGEWKECADMLPNTTTKVRQPNRSKHPSGPATRPAVAHSFQDNLCDYPSSRLALYRLLVLCLPMRRKKSITFLELPELPLLPVPCSSYASAKRLLFCSTPFLCCWFNSSPPMPAG
jgi:hypothetical protein